MCVRNRGLPKQWYWTDNFFSSLALSEPKVTPNCSNAQKIKAHGWDMHLPVHVWALPVRVRCVLLNIKNNFIYNLLQLTKPIKATIPGTDSIIINVVLFQVNLYGRCQRGVSLKRGEESRKFFDANFCLTFSYTIFKLFCNIKAHQSENYF